MRRPRDVIPQFLVALVAVFFISYIAAASFLRARAIYAARNLDCLQNSHEIMRIKIYGSSSSSAGGTVSARLSVIDSNGNEISAIERSWPGSYLSLEFSRVSLYGKNFVFPVRVYGKERISERSRAGKSYNKGTHLEKYYDDYRQCMLLGHGSSAEERRMLRWLSVFATKKYPFMQFSLAEYIDLDLSGCKSEVYYSVICGADGSIFLEAL